MLKAISVAGLTVIFFALSSCAATQNYQELAQSTDQILQTEIGGEIFRVVNTRDLPNAFGGADIWGGKVESGFIQVRYMGMTDDERAVFRRIDVEIQSDETTMSRYGVARTYTTSNTYGSVTARNTGFGTATATGSATTYTTGTTILPRKSTTNVLPPNAVEFAVDPLEQKEFTLVGITVNIIEATPFNLTYRLHQDTAGLEAGS